MNWKSLIIAAATCTALASAAAWQIQSWRYKAVMADQSHRHALEVATLQETLNRINEEAARQLVAQQKLQQEQAAVLASLEATHYQELRRAQNENARLRADVAAGRIRVPVSAVCSASDKIGAGDVPGQADTASLDDGAFRAELHPEVAGRIVGVGGEADQCAWKLTALQGWVKQTTAETNLASP
ncbi:hypothetical protein CAL18_05230 [Bordetella genomosp. 7]|uniref:lysis system i-spanin subunit Rz n=1 Tax=Bordetella genomosp. 7 TaxID=1416805 RepID=UPI000B9E305D|nr:lysis system i-spanin subunit Rz [Bordetella genomosp. 7]OZI27991.1 hypothetical protein CAL18_05230 [Bordetella genomosp. 7]